MRRCDGSQIDQDKVLDDGCYVTSTLKVTLLYCHFFKHELC